MPHITKQPYQGVVLLGTDTAVGKTTVATALLSYLRQKGLHPVPFKPVETGAAPLPTDAVALRSAAGRDDIPLSIICPYSFSQPVAPAAAASASGLRLPLTKLLYHAQLAASYGDFLVVESSGGLLSPYARDLTPADLAVALDFPALLIARNALGTVNQTSLAFAEIRRRRIPCLAILLVNTTNNNTPDQASNLGQIKHQTAFSTIATLPFLDPTDLTLLPTALDSLLDLPKLLRLPSTLPQPPVP